MSPGNLGMTYLKKNCDGCKAFQERKCVLGITLEKTTPLPNKGIFNPAEWVAPTEPCPKPRTKDKLQKHLEAMADHNQEKFL